MIGAGVSVKLVHGSTHLLLFHPIVSIQPDLDFCRCAEFRSWGFSRMSLPGVFFPILFCLCFLLPVP